MSSKSTILNKPFCHIYKDIKSNHINSGLSDEPVLVIEVDYGHIDYELHDDQSVIVVEWDSDFARMIKSMITTCGAKNI